MTAADPSSLRRVLDRAARQSADALSARLRAAAEPGRFVATIDQVIPAGAKDGNALVIVDWLGSLVTVNGFNRAYTPVEGHAVVCDLIDDQVFIAYSPVGQP